MSSLHGQTCFPKYCRAEEVVSFVYSHKCLYKQLFLINFIFFLLQKLPQHLGYRAF